MSTALEGHWVYVGVKPPFRAARVRRARLWGCFCFSCVCWNRNLTQGACSYLLGSAMC